MPVCATGTIAIPVAGNVCAQQLASGQLTQFLFTGADGAALTDWNSATEWNSRISNTAVYSSTSPKPIRQLYVKGSKAAASPTKIELGGGYDGYATAENTYTFVAYDVSTQMQAVIAYIQANPAFVWKCWFVTGAETATPYVWGGNSGVSATITASLIMPEGRADFVNYQFTVTYSGVDPSGIPKPFAG